MKRFLLLFILIPISGYSQQVILPFGSGKATFDVSNKTLTSKLDYSIGPLSYQRINKTETFAYKNKDISLQMSDKNWTLQGQNFTFNYLNSKNGKNWVLQGKNFNFNYLDSKNGLTYKNFWGQAASSKYFLKFQGNNYQAEIAKNYSDITFKFNSGALRTINTPAKSESMLSMAGKNWSVEAINAKDRVSKNLVDVKTNSMNLKFITDGSTNVTQITAKDTLFAYSGGQFFFHSKFQNIEYQFSKDNYELKYRGFYVTNKELKVEHMINKQLSVEIGTKAIINRVKVATNIGQTKFTASFNNQFSEDNFFLNQGVFNVHTVDANLISYSKRVFNKSLLMCLENSNFVFSGDVINSLYNVSAKFVNGNIGFIQDQKRNFVSLGYTKGTFNLALDYNCMIDRVDRLRLNYTLKF